MEISAQNEARLMKISSESRFFTDEAAFRLSTATIVDPKLLQIDYSNRERLFTGHILGDTRPIACFFRAFLL
jgi:hypothetical protein